MFHWRKNSRLSEYPPGPHKDRICSRCEESVNPHDVVWRWNAEHVYWEHLCSYIHQVPNYAMAILDPRRAEDRVRVEVRVHPKKK